MFTRRVLFKMLAAIGAGSLLLTVGEGEVPRLSGIGEALSFGSSVRPDGSPATLGEQAVDVTAIEQWEDLLDDLDGVELIGRYTPLTRAKDASCGIMGRCPFCRHGTDLFLVDGRDDSYFCTECFAGGHALDFYARMEEVSLSESVRPVMGLLVSGQLQGKRPRLERLLCIIDEINRFAHKSLFHSREGESALAWLDLQGGHCRTVESFSLGVLSYALGKELLERLLSMGFSPEELEKAAVNGWLSCMADRVRDGEPDLALLLPVCNAEGQCCGFYEQSIEADAEVVWSSYFLPYGFQLLSPYRAARLVFSVSRGQNSASSVVLTERPWDVVLLAQGGMEQAVYVSPLDPGEYHDRLARFMMRTRRVIWPIHQSELNVEFLRHLFSLSNESIGRLAFVVLPEGETLPAILRREGFAAVLARFAGAVPVRELLEG
jgi:DNA primase (bacterial type)